MTGRTVDAEEAERIGLVHRLIDGRRARRRRRLRARVLHAPAGARLRREPCVDTPLSEGLKIEADLSTLAFQTRDAAEGMAAFVEKRKPKFRDECRE